MLSFSMVYAVVRRGDIMEGSAAKRRRLRTSQARQSLLDYDNNRGRFDGPAPGLSGRRG